MTPTKTKVLWKEIKIDSSWIVSSGRSEYNRLVDQIVQIAAEFNLIVSSRFTFTGLLLTIKRKDDE